MSTQSVKTRSWNDLTLVRHARPYRMAVIELIFTATGQAPSFRVVFSEFGSKICTSIVYNGTGIYLINIASGSFSKTANVTTSSTISYNLTTVSGSYVDMYTGSYFNSINFNQIRLVTANLVTNTNADLIGKAMLVIKEYYG